MSISMINGYACFDCKDVEKAKRGEDPRGDGDGPGRARASRTSGNTPAGGDGASGANGPAPGAGADLSSTPSGPPARPDGQGLRIDRYA